MRKAWLITGASSGFGRALSDRALDRGDRVLMAARNTEAIADLTARYPGQASILPLDLSDAHSAGAIVSERLHATGPVDIVVNNAGYMLLGGVEEASDAQIRDIFETNFYGALAVIRAALPGMRERRSGHIINVTSAAAYSGGAGTPFYAATKFALTAISESLSLEAAHLGIMVSLVEPGAHRTSMRQNWKVAQPIADYAESVATIHARFFEGVGREPGDPDRVADAILAIADAREPPLHLPLGRDALDRANSKIAALQREFADWRELILSTSFEESA